MFGNDCTQQLDASGTFASQLTSQETQNMSDRIMVISHQKCQETGRKKEESLNTLWKLQIGRDGDTNLATQTENTGRGAKEVQMSDFRVPEREFSELCQPSCPQELWFSKEPNLLTANFFGFSPS